MSICMSSHNQYYIFIKIGFVFCKNRGWVYGKGQTEHCTYTRITIHNQNLTM